MATTNVTGDEKQEKLEHLFCAGVLTKGIQNQLILLSALNVFLSITAFLGNSLILVALYKESCLHAPSKLLFRCLATTDLCVGLISEPLNVTFMMSLVNERGDICRFAVPLSILASFILCSVSLLTLTAISVDRLLALLLGLRYRQVVTLKRTYLIVVIFWISTIVNAAVSFWNHLITLWCGYIGIALCLVTSIFSYTKIFLTLRYHQTHVQDNVQEHQSQTSHLNIARYRKAVSSALWLQLTLVVCYLPFGTVDAMTTRLYSISSTSFLVRECTITLVYLNSSLNPILYCWKIREARQAVKATIIELCCSSS